MEQLLKDLYSDEMADGWFGPDEIYYPVSVKILLASIAQWLTQDWAEYPDRGENFLASVTILECLEQLQ